VGLNFRVAPKPMQQGTKVVLECGQLELVQGDCHNRIAHVSPLISLPLSVCVDIQGTIELLHRSGKFSVERVNAIVERRSTPRLLRCQIFSSVSLAGRLRKGITLLRATSVCCKSTVIGASGNAKVELHLWLRRGDHYVVGTCSLFMFPISLGRMVPVARLPASIFV
jgi:hypothetical protein